MTIIHDLLNINSFSRSGRKLKEVLGIVIHWTGRPNQSPKETLNYFNSLNAKMNVYASAHYVIKDDIILQAIPDDEVAYHCGTSKPINDKSTQIYTDFARAKFGKYCTSPQTDSPNNCTIGIEMHPIDWEGHFSYDTWKSAKELTVHLLKKFNLTINDITYHQAITGWKNCPKLFTDHPDEFDRFVSEVTKLI